MWPLYYGPELSVGGDDALAYSSGGFLWEAAQAKGKTVTVFGEYAPAPPTRATRVRARCSRSTAIAAARPRVLPRAARERYNTHSDIPSLDRALVREYPGWTQEVPDVIKADDILEHCANGNRRARCPIS